MLFRSNWLLFIMDVIIVLAAIWIIVEVFLAVGRMKHTKQIEWSDEDVDAPTPEPISSEA